MPSVGDLHPQGYLRIERDGFTMFGVVQNMNWKATIDRLNQGANRVILGHGLLQEPHPLHWSLNIAHNL